MRGLLEGFISKEKLDEYSQYLKKEISDLQESLRKNLEEKQVKVDDFDDTDEKLEPEDFVDNDEELSEEEEELLDELLEEEEDFQGEPEELYYHQVGSFVLAEIAPEIFVNASIDAVYSDSGYYRYDITTEHGLRVISVYEHRLHTKPPYSEELFA